MVYKTSFLGIAVSAGISTFKHIWQDLSVPNVTRKAITANDHPTQLISDSRHTDHFLVL